MSRPDATDDDTPDRPLPGAAPAADTRHIILALGLGFLLAVVIVSLVEVGAKASPLRLVGVTGRHEEEMERKLASAEQEAKSLKGLVQVAEGKAKAAESAASADRGLVPLEAKVKRLEQELKNSNIATAKAESERDGLKAELSKQPPKFDERINELQNALATANKQLDKLRATAPPPGARLGEPVSTGVPIELRDMPKDMVRQLFAIPPLDKGDKPTLTILGLPDKLEVTRDEDKVVVRPRSKTNLFRAEFRIVDGFVTVAGEKLGNFPLLSSAVFCVNLGPGKDTYYHLAGADQKVPTAKTIPVGEFKYFFSHTPFNWYKTEYEDAITKGQIELAPTARVSINKEEHVLVADPNKENVLANRPTDKTTPLVTLTLEKNGALTVDVTYTKETKPALSPSGTIVAAELVRQVGMGGEKAPVRLELLRIRPALPN